MKKDTQNWFKYMENRRKQKEYATGSGGSNISSRTVTGTKGEYMKYEQKPYKQDTRPTVTIKSITAIIKKTSK